MTECDRSHVFLDGSCFTQPLTDIGEPCYLEPLQSVSFSLSYLVLFVIFLRTTIWEMT